VALPTTEALGLLRPSVREDLGGTGHINRRMCLKERYERDGEAAGSADDKYQSRCVYSIG